MPEWRPDLINLMHAAKRATFHDASIGEQEATERWIRERRAQASARRHEQRTKMRRIVDLALAGATIAEIATAIAMSPRSIERISARLGLRLGRTATRRRLLIAPVAAEHSAALDRLAADYGATKGEVLFTLIRYLLDDDGHIARRLLRIPKKNEEAGAPAGDQDEHRSAPESGASMGTSS